MGNERWWRILALQQEEAITKTRLKERKERTVTVGQRNRIIVVGAVSWTGVVSMHRQAKGE